MPGRRHGSAGLVLRPRNVAKRNRRGVPAFCSCRAAALSSSMQAAFSNNRFGSPWGRGNAAGAEGLVSTSASAGDSFSGKFRSPPNWTKFGNFGSVPTQNLNEI